MLNEPTQSTTRETPINAAGRYIVGYLIAVGVASFLFAAITYLFPYIGYSGRPTLSDLAYHIANATGVVFVIGTVFGIPYTVLATIAFKRWLPKSMALFLLLGTLAPIAAALLLVMLIDGGGLMGWNLVETLLPALPAGLAGA